MGFRTLRVINEDEVAPGQGFGTHGHRDMEIVTYVLKGELEHKDSLGTGSVIRPGEVQRMSAGSGIRHSEFNASKTVGVHLLQIWIFPERNGLAPEYEQKDFSPALSAGKRVVLASRTGSEGSVRIHQDVSLFGQRTAKGVSTSYSIAEKRHLWVQVAQGEVEVESGGEKLTLANGDGAAISGVNAASILSLRASEVLVFDLN